MTRWFAWIEFTSKAGISMLNGIWGWLVPSLKFSQSAVVPSDGRIAELGLITAFFVIMQATILIDACRWGTVYPPSVRLCNFIIFMSHSLHTTVVCLKTPIDLFVGSRLLIGKVELPSHARLSQQCID